jgi:hypothetical protein
MLTPALPRGHPEVYKPRSNRAPTRCAPLITELRQCVDQPVTKVRLWTSHSADRDFRDENWTSRELQLQPGSSQAGADVPKPAAGFTAFLAEVELTAPTGHTYKLSTQVQVTPIGRTVDRSG